MTIWDILSEIALENGDDKIYCTDEMMQEMCSTNWGVEWQGDDWTGVVYGDRCIYSIETYDGTNGILVIPRKIPEDLTVFTAKA